MRAMTLNFHLGELIEVVFQENPSNEPRVCVRGKTAGPNRSAGSFQWTSAVKALSLLAVKTALMPDNAILRGDGHSLAASLDYAISKQPMWLSEMFGWDTKGVSLTRRLILRTNPERKRPGPVTLGINQVYLSPSAITILINGRPASVEQLTVLHTQLEGLEVREYAQAA